VQALWMQSPCLQPLWMHLEGPEGVSVDLNPEK